MLNITAQDFLGETGFKTSVQLVTEFANMQLGRIESALPQVDQLTDDEDKVFWQEYIEHTTGFIDILVEGFEIYREELVAGQAVGIKHADEYIQLLVKLEADITSTLTSIDQVLQRLQVV